jgi:hypothetical protein
MSDTVVYDLKQCTLFLYDGTGTPNTLEVKFDEGSLKYTRKRNIEYKKNRGILDTTREGDEEPLDVSFEGRFNAIVSSSGDVVTVTEFLEQEGAASAYESTGAACEPYAVDLILEVEHDCGSMEDEVITFSEFRFESLGGDFKAGTLSVSGKCNVVKPSAVRTTLA